MYTDILMKMIFSLKGGGGAGQSEPHETPLQPQKECHTKKYCQGEPQTKKLSVTATNRGIDRDCQKQKYCQGVKQSKVLQGSATI